MASSAETPTIESDAEDSDNERHFKRSLINAIEQNDFLGVKNLMSSGKFHTSTYIDTRDSTDKNNSLLHIAIRTRKRKIQEENTKIIELLIKNGANIEAKNDLGDTPLHLLEKRAKTSSQRVDWKQVFDMFPVTNTSNLLAKSVVRKGDQAEISNKFSTSAHITSTEELMETEHFCFTGNPTYEASGLKLNLHGGIYQLQLLMLFLHRSIHLYECVYLATELDQAFKFDDIVLKFKVSKGDKTWTYKFLQAKHLLDTSKNSITVVDLFSTSSKARFSLHKYFDSFCQIKDNRYFEGDMLQEFIICTNVDFDRKAKEYFIEDTNFKNDKILFIKQHQNMQKYKLKLVAKNSKTQTRNLYELIAKNLSKEKYLKEFLEKFRFIVKYPNRSQINKLITNELGKYFGLLNSNLASNSFKNDILNWFMSYKNKRSEFLLIKDGKHFLNSIACQINLLITNGLSLAYPEKLADYNLEFATIPDVIQRFINDNTFQILDVTSESPLLSCIRISQYLNQIKLYKIKDSCIFVELKSLCIENIRNILYESYSDINSYNLLIINCVLDNKIKRKSLISIYEKLLDIICNNDKKKVILIGNSDNKLSKKLLESNSGVSYTKLNDENSLAKLTTSAQSNILNKSVYLQGRRVFLKDILDINSANILIKNAVLVKLIKEEDIRIDEFGLAPERDVLFYKDRTLSHQLIKAAALEDEHFLSTNVVLITGADYQTLTANLKISKQYTNIWTEGKNVTNGVILLQDASLCATTIFEEIYKYHPRRNIYWLVYKEGRFIWKQFFGEANALRHFIDNNFDNIEEEQLTKVDFLENKINLVSADPGAGKSSLMSNFAQSMRTIYPNWWTKRVNLNSYVSSKNYFTEAKNGVCLDDIHFSEDDTNAAIIFLSNMLFAMQNSEEELYFEKRLFQMSLKICPNTLIKLTLIFDGFDEISPSYKQQTIVLLKALRKSNVAQLWVTTRTHEKHTLEDALNVPALHLNAFTNEQKFEYIQNFTNESAEHVTPKSLSDVYNRVCACLEDISLSSDNRPSEIKRSLFRSKPSPSPEELLRDALKAEFTNVPLHLNMLAEVAFSPEVLQAQVLSIPSLYEKFTNKKFSIYYGEKALTSSEVQSAKEICQRDINNILDIHASIAFERMFPDLADEIIDFDEAELARIGFLSFDGRRLQFVHWSFAEYFVVYYLRKHIRKEYVQRILWVSILADDHYRLVRTFINENEHFLKDISRECIDKILRMQCKDDFFVYLKENHSNIIKFFFTLIRRNNTEILDTMEFDLKGDYTAGFNVRVETDRKFLILLHSLKYDEYFFSEMCPSIMSTYEHKSYYVRATSPLYILMRHYTGPDITKVLDYVYTKEVQDIRDGLSRFCDLILLPSTGTYEGLMHVLAERGKFDYMKQLIIWICSHIPQLLLSGFLHTVTENDHRTFLHVMNYNVQFDDCFSYLFEKFEAAEMIKLCKSSDNNGQTVIHHIIITQMTSNPIKVLLKLFEEYFDSDTIKNILFKTDNDHKTAFHYNPAQRETLSVLMHFSTNYFAPNIFNQLLLLTDYESRTILHYIAENSDDLGYLLNYLKINFNNLQGIRNILLHLDQRGRSAVHLAVENANSSDGILALFTFMYQMFDYCSMKELLFAEDVHGQTALHRSCYNLNWGGMIKDIIDYAVQYLNCDDFNTFIRKKDLQGRNVLHHASSSFKCTIVETLLNSLKDHYETDLIKGMIIEQDDNGGTILHNALGRNLATIEFILGYVRNDNYDLGLFKQLLLKKNNQNKTILGILDDDTALEVLGSSYNWLFSKLRAECEQRNNQVIIYWSELDELGDYIGKCSRWIRDSDLKQELNNIYDYLYNHSSWTQVDENEWILKI